jgi:hypothetical protein
MHALEWRRRKINEIFAKVKRGISPTWIERDFCNFWKESWIFETKWI